MNVIPYGPNALLLRFAENADDGSFHISRILLEQLERNPPDGLREVIPAFTTILLILEPEAVGAATNYLHSLKADFSPDKASPSRERLIELPVYYAGPDLPRVAEHAGLAVGDVIKLHTEPTYRVHCLGFSPGFPYLGGLDPRLHTPRLRSPRPKVPTGTVAIGGEHTGIYSIPSPGGWNLIGSTPEVLFDPHATELNTIFRLRAGDQVRFRSVSAPPPTRDSNDGPPHPVTPASGSGLQPVLEVREMGLGLTIQDSGRPGFGRFGVPIGGAMDSMAADWANRLLDNPPDAPVLELCLQGQRLAVLNDSWVAITGNAAGQLADRAPWSAFRVRAGDTLEFHAGAHGVWSYLAVPGGFAADHFLGSVSTNPRAGIGTTLTPGSLLSFGSHAQLILPSSTATRRVPWTDIPDPPNSCPLRVWPGPQWASFSDSDKERFFAATWTVSSQCDRVGYRLVGPQLRADAAQIISEPVLPGTIQVPASGQPIVTMPDGPTLGGYPKLGWVDSKGLVRLAQSRPGQTVRFELI